RCARLHGYRFLFLCGCATVRVLLSFPTRRSSDLLGDGMEAGRPSSGFGCANRGEAGLKPLTISQMPKASSNAAIGSVARPLSGRSEEHTSELQSRSDLVCRLLLEKKKTRMKTDSR